MPTSEERTTDLDTVRYQTTEATVDLKGLIISGVSGMSLKLSLVVDLQGVHIIPTYRKAKTYKNH